MPNDIQQKELKHINFEIKQDSLTEQGTFEGYASIFGNEDNHGDIVLKGAFTDTLKETKPKLLYQHDPRKPVGVFDEVREDDKGLYVKGRLLLENSLAKDVYALIKGGAISGISIGYQTVKSRWDEENEVRYLEKVKLYEASIVTFPANESATVENVKSEQPTKINIEEIKNIREAERVLKNKTKGLTREEITGIVSKIKDVSIQEYLKENKAKETNSEMQAVVDLAKQIVKIYE